MDEKAELALMGFPCGKSKSNYDKWLISLRTAILFLIISSPFLYKLVNESLGKLFGFSIATQSGCPSYSGLLLHSFVFAVLLRAIM